MHLDANNLYRSARSLKLPVNIFKRVKNAESFNETKIKHYHRNRNKGYFLEADVEYPKDLLSNPKI